MIILSISKIAYVPDMSEEQLDTNSYELVIILPRLALDYWLGKLTFRI